MNQALLIVAACYVLICIYDRIQKKIAYVVHIQGQTESGEVMDFTINLFKSEPEEIWMARLNKAFEIKGQRLKHNNDAIMSETERLHKQFEESKHQKQVES